MQIELMSPAGNFNAFLEALENGADSIYLGLKQFNARRPAENFTIYQLKKAIKIAKDNNKKIYLALNIELKSNELKDAAAILELAKGLKIDALIIKDPALIYLINKFYSKELSMHFSTQCSVDSSYGVKFAKSLGAKRVVLARELTLDEIKNASDVNGIETEFFAEGSMCFSISGRCLMSSWVGGRSGNRGVCTAPCRVLWNKENKKELFFSMKDMSLVKYMEDIKHAGVGALKIEGRLKRPSWVGEITKIYRKAIDDSQDESKLDMLYQELSKHSAREVGTGHIKDHAELIGKNEEWGNYSKSTIESTIKFIHGKNVITIDTENNEINIEIDFYSKKQKLILPFPPQPKKAKVILFDNIKNYFSKSLIDDYSIEINIKGDEYLSLSSSSIQKIVNDIEKLVKKIIDDEEKLPELRAEVIEYITPEADVAVRKRERILGDYPDKIIINTVQVKNILEKDLKITTIVVMINNRININELKKLKDKYKLILSIPSVLYESDAKKMYGNIKELFKLGFNIFEANSYTGMQILQDYDCKKYLGTGLTVMNHLATKKFYELGYESIYATIEAESSVYKALSSFTDGNIEALVFGKIPLFISRVDSIDFEDGAVFNDKFVEIECHKENGLNIYLTKNPFSLTGEKVKSLEVIFDNLSADLRYFKDPLSVLNSIFRNEFNEKNSSSFNFFKKLV